MTDTQEIPQIITETRACADCQTVFQHVPGKSKALPRCLPCRRAREAAFRVKYRSAARFRLPRDQDGNRISIGRGDLPFDKIAAQWGCSKQNIQAAEASGLSKIAQKLRDDPEFAAEYLGKDSVLSPEQRNSPTRVFVTFAGHYMSPEQRRYLSFCQRMKELLQESEPDLSAEVQQEIDDLHRRIAEIQDPSG